MFGCTAGGAAAVGFNLGDLLTQIANIIQMVIDYILDLFVPYTPPEPGTCTGPSISDATGQSCNGVNIPCKDRLNEMCEGLDDLPGVSVAFKKCMKGRCGCGGSRHKRAKVSCAGVYTCGPCRGTPAGGCSINGTRIWYCTTTSNVCDCANTVFHEMSHSCGANDVHNGNTYDADRIGMWFEDEYRAEFTCIPVN
mgnify:CR=1 FL=1